MLLLLLLLFLLAVDVAVCLRVAAAVLLIDSCPRVPFLVQRSEDPIPTGRIDDCIEGRAMFDFLICSIRDAYEETARCANENHAKGLMS